MSRTVTIQIPEGWGDDELTRFLDMARGNTFASFAQAPSHHEKLLRVDSAYRLISENLLNPPDFGPPFFLLRSHASFRAAAGLAMAGQSSEAFMAMRGCLESALYGLYVKINDDAFDIWVRRNEDDDAKMRVQREFTIRRMWDCLRGVDEGLQTLAETLYDKTIDFGAHPNAASLLSALNMSRSEKGIRFQLAYLSAEPDVLRGTMKSVAQTGVMSLSIFRHALPERYDILGLTAQLPALRAGL